jgi:hypothetical protein
MLTVMCTHVDEFRGPPDSTDGRVNYRFRGRNERDYRTVVIGIDMRVEDAGLPARRYGIGN